MTELLKKAFDAVLKLPPETQDRIVEYLNPVTYVGPTPAALC